MKKRTPIQMPARTVATLEALLNQQRIAQVQIDAIVGTSRDILDVPEDYVLRNTTVGFEPPEETPAAEA